MKWPRPMYYQDSHATIYHGDSLSWLKKMDESSVNCCVTSPPYWGLRDYGVEGQLGLGQSPEAYIQAMIDVFREVRRVLADNGTLWLNLGDTYGTGTTAVRPPGNRGIGACTQEAQDNVPSAGGPAKQLMGIPWKVAFALQADDWYLRSDIIWEKPNPMPESVSDRPTKSHEYIFLMSKNKKYYYDADAIKVQASPESHARYARGRSDTHKWADGGPGNQTIAKSFEHMRKPGVHPKSAEPGSGIKSNSSFSAAVKDLVDVRNKRTVWRVATAPYSGAHFATFPPKLITPCILAGCAAGDVVLDPFGGSMTTAMVAKDRNRRSISIELNEEYIELGKQRLAQGVLAL